MVGTSGTIGMRTAEVTPSARSLPAFTSGRLDAITEKLRSVRP